MRFPYQVGFRRLDSAGTQRPYTEKNIPTQSPAPLLFSKAPRTQRVVSSQFWSRLFISGKSGYFYLADKTFVIYVKFYL